MNKFFDKLVDRILAITLTVLKALEPFPNRKDKNSVILHFDIGIAIIVASIIAAGTGTAMSMQNRKAQKKMAKKQQEQQAREAKRLAEASEATRMPLPPKDQQLTIQGTPKTAKQKTSSLGIKARSSGKRGLRTGSTGNYGARIA